MAAVTFDQALDFTRGSEGTYIGPDGLIKTAAADEPRFTHDPVTREPLGLLIEEQRTNLLRWSEDFTQGAWSVESATIEPAGLSPSGSTAFRVTTIGGGSDRLHQGIAIPLDSSTYTLSLWIKKEPGYSLGSLNLRLTGGSGPEVYYTPESAVDSEWIRASLSITNDGTNNTLYVRPVRGFSPIGATEPRRYIIADAQLEQGSYPSSYIPTQDAQVTRAADSVSRTLGQEFSPSSGTVFLDQRSANKTGSFSLVIGKDRDAYLGLNYSTTVTAYFLPFTAGITAPNSNWSGRNKFAASWQVLGPNSVRLIVARNGEIVNNEVYSGDTSTIAEWDQLSINDRFGDFRRSGKYEGVALFPRALSEAELIALTTPEA